MRSPACRCRTQMSSPRLFLKREEAVGSSDRLRGEEGTAWEWWPPFGAEEALLRLGFAAGLDEASSL